MEWSKLVDRHSRTLYELYKYTKLLYVFSWCCAIAKNNADVKCTHLHGPDFLSRRMFPLQSLANPTFRTLYSSRCSGCDCSDPDVGEGARFVLLDHAGHQTEHRARLLVTTGINVSYAINCISDVCSRVKLFDPGPETACGKCTGIWNFRHVFAKREAPIPEDKDVRKFENFIQFSLGIPAPLRGVAIIPEISPPFATAIAVADVQESEIFCFFESPGTGVVVGRAAKNIPGQEKAAGEKEQRENWPTSGPGSHFIFMGYIL